MKTGIDMARCYLSCCGYSLVVVKKCVEIISHEKGIMPLLMIYDDCPEKLEGAALADKVIGKAAAFILAETGIAEVYGETMSVSALPILENKGIKYSYGKLVPDIMNSDRSDLCPMEKICRDIDTPIDGIMAITAFICLNKGCNCDPERNNNETIKYN